MSEKQSFWATLPGIITGLAAILTGGATIIAFVVGLGSDDEPSADTAAPEAVTDSPASGRRGGGTEIEPQAVIAPRTIDFGQVGRGEESQQTVTVANSGTGYLGVQEVEVSGQQDAFSVDAKDCLGEAGVEPQGECDISVTFHPPSSGSHSAVVQIEHTGPTSPSQVSVSGEGSGRLLDL